MKIENQKDLTSGHDLYYYWM